MGWKSFEDLDIWKRSCQLAVYVYRALNDSRDFGIRSQMQRATVSIPSNIAEGSERSRKEFCRFLAISLGSNAELRTQAYIAEKIDVLPHDQRTHIVDETKQLGRMIQSFKRQLESGDLEN